MKAAPCAIVLVGLLASCSSNAYLTHRARDLGDVFTLEAGLGLGAEARVGPVQVGLLVAGNFGEGADELFGVNQGGLRGGEVVGPEDADEHRYSYDVNLLLVGSEEFTLGKKTHRRGKTVYAESFGPLALPRDARSLEGEDAESHAANAERFGYRYDPWPFYTELEVVLGLGEAVRFGFNPGELLDFVLGWFTIDIYSDDVSFDDEP